MDSYEKILIRMEDKYFELTGIEPERASDTDIKLKLLAGELFSLNTQIDWLRRQLLPDTATGEQLDAHAGQCGITRRAGNKAVGDISFAVDVPLEFNVTIPAGTICTTSDGALNYVTMQDVVIRRGESFALVSAQAQRSGKQYNVSPGKITTIVTYFSVGLSISNTSAFSGGTDDEDDESLRKRLFQSYGKISNGANKAYYEKLAESVDGVGSAHIAGIGNSWYLYIAGVGGTAPASAMQRVRSLISENLVAGMSCNFSNCPLVNSDIVVEVKPASAYTFADVSGRVTQSINEYYNSLRIGQKMTLAALGGAVIATPGVENYTFTSGTDKNPGSNGLVVLQSLTINEQS